MLGYTEEDLIGQSGAILFTPEDRENGEVERELDLARRDGRTEQERWHLRKDASRFWASGVTALLRDESNRIIGFAKVLRDQTRRMQAEQALWSMAERQVMGLVSTTHCAW